MGGLAQPCHECGGMNYHGGHRPGCFHILDDADCPGGCGCAVRAHTDKGCRSHGCKAEVAHWFKRREEQKRREGELSPEGKVIDLMAALRESLAKQKPEVSGE